MDEPFVACVECGKAIIPTTPGVFRLVQGWVEARRSGGANAVIEKVDLHKYCHGTCMRLRRLDKNQESLF